MKKIKLLGKVLVGTGADRIIITFLIFFFVVAFFIMLAEPGIDTYSDAVWYTYAVFSTAGFGDITPVTFVGRILSIFLTIYTILVCGVVTGVIVAFYNDMVAMRYKASKAEILDKLEHLDTLSTEELAELSERIRNIS